jgi:hypothetical protein
MTPPGSGCPFYVLSMKNFFAFTRAVHKMVEKQAKR